MAQPYFTGNTSGAIDYQGMQAAMGLGPQTQPINTQGPLSTQNWVKNDVLPPQLQLQDMLQKNAIQQNTLAQTPIANMLQQQQLAHSFGENQMLGPQQQLLQQQVQEAQLKNQFTTPEAYYQSLQSDLANHAKSIQDGYGVNVGEAASELHQIPVTDPTGKQTMAQAGYDPNTQTLYVPPKTVMNPMLGIPTAMPAQQISMPLGVHLFAKEIGAKQAGFQSYADMAQRATVQNLQAQQALLQQQKTQELQKYSAANPFGATSPAIVSNGAPSMPAPGINAAAQSHAISNYGDQYGGSTNPPNSSNPIQFQAMQAAMNAQNAPAVAQPQGAPTFASNLHNTIVNGIPSFIGNAQRTISGGFDSGVSGAQNFLHQLISGQTDTPYAPQPYTGQ